MTEHTTVAQALELLVHAAAQAPEDRWTLAALGAAVAELEAAAGVGLGPVEHDPLVVLARRLGRVHRVLDADPGRVDVERVQAHRRALELPRAHGPAPVLAAARRELVAR